MGTLDAGRLRWYTMQQNSMLDLRHFQPDPISSGASIGLYIQSLRLNRSKVQSK